MTTGPQTPPTKRYRQRASWGVNVSEFARQAPLKRLDDEALDQEIHEHAAAFAAWDEADYDQLAGDGLVND